MDKVADMEVDMVVDMVADIEVDTILYFFSPDFTISQVPLNFTIPTRHNFDQMT